MKKQALIMLIAIAGITLMQRSIVCMDNKQINLLPKPNEDLNILKFHTIISDIELSQNDINECTKELKEKYNDIVNIKEEDHELLREGIIDASIVIAQAKKNDVQELLSFRQALYEQYKKFKTVGENFCGYDSLHGAMRINNTQENTRKHEDEFNRVRTQDSHQFVIDHDVQKIKNIEYDICELESRKKFFLERSIYAKKEIEIIKIIQHIANLEKPN